MSTTELRKFGVDLFDRWTTMWNGDVTIAAQIMAREFTLRYAQASTDLIDDVHTPDALGEFVTRWRQVRQGLKFIAEGETVVDLTIVDGQETGRVARPYLAVFVDAAMQRIARSGIDMFKVSGARIVEVWSVSSGAAGRTFYRT